MNPEVEQSAAAVNDFGSDDNSETATSVSGFAAAEQQRPETRKRPLAQLNHVDSDVIGRFYRTEPINLTPADGKNFENVEGSAARSAGTRSQYHSIRELSQSGRSGDSCGLFPGTEAAVYGQTWLGCARFPTDLSSDCEEDTLHVLRSLLRRYDRCADTRMTAGVFDSDEAASGRGSNSDLSGDDLEERSSQMTLRRSPTTKTLQAKRARVEHIVSNIRTPSYAEDTGTEGSNGSRRATGLELRADERRRSKRKQTLPQQHDSTSFDNEYHRSLNGNASDDDDDDESRIALTTEDSDDEVELRQQLRVVQLRLQDMYAKYTKSLHVDDLYHPASRCPDDDSRLETESKTSDEAQRLTGLLRAEVRHMVDALVDGLIQRFLTKHFAGRRQPAQSSPPTDDQPPLQFPRLSPLTSLPVFPPPPPLFPFPVVGGDVLGLRRAYAERCAYVDALVQRARTTCPTDPDTDTLNYNHSTSGTSVTSSAMTSSTSEIVDHHSLMSVISSRCLLPDQQLLQPTTQVPSTQ